MDIHARAARRRIAAVLTAVTLAGTIAIPGCAIRTQTPDGPADDVPGAQNDRAVEAIPQADAAGEAARKANEKAAEAQKQVDELNEQP